MRDLNVKFNDGSTVKVAYGSDILSILEENGQLDGTKHPVTSALVNNELQSLSSRLKINAEIKPVFLNSDTGARVYRKTLTALLSKVCSGMFPDRKTGCRALAEHRIFLLFRRLHLGKQ